MRHPELGLPLSPIFNTTVAVICATALSACPPFKGDLGGLDSGSDGTTAVTATDGATDSATAETGDDPGDTADPTEVAEQCAVQDAQLYFPFHYVRSVENLDATCVLSSVDAQPDSTTIHLLCGDEMVELEFLGPPGLHVDWVPFIDTSLEVHTKRVGDGDITGRYVMYASLRSDTRLIYTSMLGEALDFAPGVSYAPLELEATFGQCPFVATPGDGGGDGFWCQGASRMELSLAVEDDPAEPQVLQSGQVTDVLVEGGRYNVAVQTMLRGMDCSTDPVSPLLDTYAFSIVWRPD